MRRTPLHFHTSRKALEVCPYRGVRLFSFSFQSDFIPQRWGIPSEFV